MKKKLNNWMKILLMIIGVLTVTALGIFQTPLFLSDIRPEELKGDYTLTHSGKFYLEKAQSAHGMDVWLKQDSISFEIHQHIQDALAKFKLAPGEKSEPQYHMISFPKNRQASYYESIKTEPSYFIACDDKGTYKKIDRSLSYGHSNIHFFYYAIQHLLEFPFEMGTADILEYIGEDEMNNQSYELVFASWESLKPSLEYDQYIIWVNKKTGLIDRFDATGRDIMPFAKARVDFEYPMAKEELILPNFARVRTASPEERPIMTVKVVSMNPSKK
ncbi:MAG: hypothetical protein AAF696_38865 [Bacteroidota bacterium]